MTKSKHLDSKEGERLTFERYSKTGNIDLLGDYHNAIRRVELDRLYNHDPSDGLRNLAEIEQVVLERMCNMPEVNLRIQHE